MNSPDNVFCKVTSDQSVILPNTLFPTVAGSRQIKKECKRHVIWGYYIYRLPCICLFSCPQTLSRLSFKNVYICSGFQNSFQSIKSRDVTVSAVPGECTALAQTNCSAYEQVFFAVADRVFICIHHI